MLMGLFAWAPGFTKIGVKIVLLFIGFILYSIMNFFKSTLLLELS